MVAVTKLVEGKETVGGAGRFGRVVRLNRRPQTRTVANAVLHLVLERRR